MAIVNSTTQSRQVPRTCGFCGNQFTTFISNVARGNGKYCTLQCAVKARTEPIENRFWRYVTKTDGCWVWQGYVSPKGYGTIMQGGRNRRPILAHRFAYELFNGKIPDGLFVCHTCDNPPCVNPSHLFLGTNQDNVDDMVSKLRQPQGEKHWNTNLTDEKVRAIRQSFATGKLTQVQIAAAFHVNKITVFDIIHRKTWKHID